MADGTNETMIWGKLLLKPYTVKVQGFDPITYFAPSHGVARAKAWRGYCSYNDINFGEFMRISTVRRAPNPPGYGDRIIVADKPAYRIPDRFGTHFVRPNDTVVMSCHPSEVRPTPAEI